MRLALFGGTFDPIHNAHLTVAREAADQFHLEQVWFSPGRSSAAQVRSHRRHL